jgi:hypothetical protein
MSWINRDSSARQFASEICQVKSDSYHKLLIEYMELANIASLI